ncbi:MAG: ASKHA domain-containing protein [Blautia sp.]|jgi:uncharacterized 2Fe-2S/4Fe-4S cluster protein (DUF4445 family)
MTEKYTLDFLREKTALEVPAGTTLMSALKEAGIFLDAPCAGHGTCGKCLVKISRDGKPWETVKACQEKITNATVIDTSGSRLKHQILTTSYIRQVPFLPQLPAIPEVKDCCMAAFDIGTTTIAAYLLEGQTGKELCTASSLNPQAAYGADVISRANYVLEHGPKELSDCIHRAVDSLIGELVKKVHISRENITLVCFVGNTCMHHIFFGLPMESLVRAPYEPYEKSLRREKAADFQISIHPEGELLFLPVIAGFVGADTMGCLLSLRPDLKEEITLMLDIGTNGELVLGNKDKLVCCSTAAGPAFEGAKITCGMRGAQGAIDHVFFDGSSFSFSVIGGGRPKGLCGSGLIDTIACLRRAGLIDETGRLLDKEEVWELNKTAEPAKSPEADKEANRRQDMASHMARIDNLPAFLFDPKDSSVYLTQKDIREVQLAKGAIAAGILLLEKHLSIAHEDISQVYIAGAFGNYMEPQSACDIGLLPGALRKRITPVGNAAGEGAKISLLNKEELNVTKRLMNEIDFLELAAIPEFQDCFVDELEFPELVY